VLELIRTVIVTAAVYQDIRVGAHTPLRSLLAPG